MKFLRLGQVLIEEKVITAAQLEEALERQKVSKKRLGQVILDMNFTSERVMLQALAKRLNVPYVDAPLFEVQMDVVKLVSESFARKYHIIPLNLSKGVLTIAMNDPLNFACLEDLRMITGFEVKSAVSPNSEIEIAINRIYSRQSSESLVSEMDTDPDQRQMAEDAALAASVDSAPVVKLVNNLITDAYHSNASDIHIEPNEKSTNVRFRINGDLQKHTDFSAEIHQLISTRIKIISGMNIAEKRIPQDGAFQFKQEHIVFDIRVSSIPTPYGEKLVLRLLGADRNIDYKLASLGLSSHNEEAINKITKLPHGIVLVTGPTGSGKTTTLYSMLAQIADVKKSIVTVEDPIEKKFNAITQVQINPRSGLTFASGLRSILRQDPDIIMVGEIRDSETAQIAIRAAITGHLVLSTLHTNDAISTVIRLVDMGVEPFLVASSVKCVISQRLVKTICPKCKMEHPVTEEENMVLQTNFKTTSIGKGCVDCNHTGYAGRTAVFEILLIDNKIAELITNKASVDDIRKYANENNVRMLREETLDLVESGKTSLDEAIRLLYSVD